MPKSILAIRLIFSLLFVLSLVTESNAYTNLEYKWLVFDTKSNSYITATPQKLKQTEAIYFWLTRSDAGYKSLKLSLPEKTSFFIKNKFLFSSKVELDLTYDSDSLFQSWNSNDSLLISLYKKGGDWKNLKTLLVAKNEDLSQRGEDEELIKPEKRDKAGNEIYILGFLSITIFLGVYKLISPKDFNYYFNLFGLFDLNLRKNKEQENSIFSRSNIIFFLILSLNLGLLLMYSQSTINIYRDILDTEGKLWMWLGNSVIVFFILLSKIALIGIFGGLFSIGQALKNHFSEYFRLSSLIYLLLSILVLLVLFSNISIESKWLFRLYLILLVIRSLSFYIRIRQQSTTNNLHLFSYLCTVDFIPTLVILNFFLEK